MVNWLKPELEVLDVNMTLKGVWGGTCDRGHHHHGPGKCPDPTNPNDPVIDPS